MKLDIVEHGVTIAAVQNDGGIDPKKFRTAATLLFGLHDYVLTRAILQTVPTVCLRGQADGELVAYRIIQKIAPHIRFTLFLRHVARVYYVPGASAISPPATICKAIDQNHYTYAVGQQIRQLDKTSLCALIGFILRQSVTEPHTLHKGFRTEIIWGCYASKMVPGIKLFECLANNFIV